MVCGIYQISNTINGKSYIGQSRNIYRRWRQHTRGLDSPNALAIGSYPLRHAFLKYELRELVDKPGNTGIFEFKIIEKCTEDKLLERERFWINEIDPEYNCNLWTPARKKKAVDSEPKFWIQYHNYNALGYLPVEYKRDMSQAEECEYDEVLSGVSTNKRAVLNTVGDTVFLIVGIGDKPKQYYFWSTFLCEETVTNEYEDGYSYDAYGSGHLIVPPRLLNSEEFNKFRGHCGNFGFGLMCVKDPEKDPAKGSLYLNVLKKIAEESKPKASKLNFSQFIKDFYAQVTHINPNEFSAYHKRGYARHLTVSLYVENALALLAGEYSILLIFFDPDNWILNYKDSTLLVHSLNFYDFKTGKEYLESYEFDEESFPINAIQGWVTVESVFKYDETRFLADKELHLQENNLSYYQEIYGSDVWGIAVKEPVILHSAICNVFQPEDIDDGDLWEADDISQLNAFYAALKTKIKHE